MAFQFVFATDLHGIVIHYKRLFRFVQSQKIECLIFGGDLCPAGFVFNDFGQFRHSQRDFLKGFFFNNLRDLKNSIPAFQCFVIMGNDDLRANYDLLVEAESEGILNVIHQKARQINNLQILGYCFVPPTPFLIKDWEKYENSNRIIEPIAIPPEDGYRSTEIFEKSTIEKDLSLFQGSVQAKKTIFVSHCPPYKTNLDHSTKDRYYYEGLKLDKHLGSVAIRNFIESAQPIVSLHGHIHESTAISGKCFDYINGCLCLNGAFEIEDTQSTQILLVEIGKKIFFEKIRLT